MFAQNGLFYHRARKKSVVVVNDCFHKNDRSGFVAVVVVDVVVVGCFR